MGKIDRSRISLRNRTQEQTNSVEDKTVATRQNFVDFKSWGDAKFFKLGDKDTYHDINIVPWQIATNNHPSVYKGTANIGDWDYVLDLYVHTYIGPTQVSVICPKKTYGKFCPICDEANRLWKDGEEDAARLLFSKRRCVYAIQELDENQKPTHTGVKILEIAHSSFSKALQEEATNCLRGRGVVDFSNPDKDNGKVVSFRVGTGKMGGGREFKLATAFKFIDRDQEISDSVLECVEPLDKFLVIKSSKELSHILFGEDVDSAPEFESDSNEPPRTRQQYREEEPNVIDEPPRDVRGLDAAAQAIGDELNNKCPNKYHFGADCDKKPLCFKCPDSIYNECRCCSK